MHHPKSDVDRLYLPRTDGGRGLNQLEMAYETTLIGLGRYLETTTDPMLQAVLKYEKCKKNSIIIVSRKLKQPTMCNQNAERTGNKGWSKCC